MNFVAKFVNGRLHTEMFYEAETFLQAVERAEVKRTELEMLFPQGARTISVSETKKQ